MSNDQFPEPEDFAAAVQLKMAEGRKWSWLAEVTGIGAGTLKFQLVTSPSALKLRTALRVGKVLGISIWEPETEAAA